MQNGAVFRGYVGSDGKHYMSLAAMPVGVTAASAPNATAFKADALLPGQVANAGAAGNLCHVDCSKRGVCSYKTGLCTCLAGSFGDDCSI